MLRFHRILDAHAAQDLGRKARQAGDAGFGALGQRIAGPQAAVIGDADDVAGPGFLGEVAVAGQKEHRVLHRHEPPRTLVFQLHAAPEAACADAQKGNPITVLRIDVRLHLENEPSDSLFLGPNRGRLGRLRPRRRREPGHALQQLAYPEVVDRAAEKYRRQVTLAVRIEIEFRAQTARHFDLFA